MLSFIVVLIGLFVLGVLVTIHEAGHFVAAKACGIRVLSFSLGFGPVLIKKVIDKTEYRISAIPFGGYVHMAGENPDEMSAAVEGSFTSKPVWQRAIVAVAGPAANIITAFLFLLIMFITGVPEANYLSRPVVGAVADSSAAQIAGIAAGDSILSINGKLTKNWSDVQECFGVQGGNYTITMLRKGAAKTAIMKIAADRSGNIPTGITGGLMSSIPPVVGSILDGSAAQEAGLAVGDSVIALDNTTMHSWQEFSLAVRKYNPAYGPMQIVVSRKSQVVILSASPKPTTVTEKKSAGIKLAEKLSGKSLPVKSVTYFRLGAGQADAPSHITSFSPVKAVVPALEKSWDYTTMIFDVLGKLVSSEIPANQLAGPIGIVQMSGMVALGGIASLLNFMALIGINLGVINLFPLVITDGGQLLFLAIEAVRRKPLPPAAHDVMNRIAIAFFVLLFIFVTFHDILRAPQLFAMIK